MDQSVIYIGNTQPNSYGVSVIVDNIASVFNRHGNKAEVIYSLDGIPKDAFIIPYGIDMAIEMIKKGYKTEAVFMADAFTLGCINKIKFYLAHHYIFHYDFFYSIYCLLRDYRLESKVLKHFKKIALVSDTDIEYLKKRAPQTTKFFCMPNGANFVDVEPKTKSGEIRLGILSNWWHTVLAEENGWFIKEYFHRYTKSHPNVKLILAGIGSYINQFEKYPNVEIMGEVADLNTFFKNIDIYIVANPKGCGILNRVLDAFAYKTCVLGYKNAFTGFRYMRDCFMEFDNYESFEKGLELLINNEGKRKELVEKAYSQIQKNNVWDVNIVRFMNFTLE